MFGFRKAWRARAVADLADATAQLEHVIERDRAVITPLVERADRVKERNRFGERIETAFRRRLA